MKTNKINLTDHEIDFLHEAMNEYWSYLEDAEERGWKPLYNRIRKKLKRSYD